MMSAFLRLERARQSIAHIQQIKDISYADLMVLLIVAGRYAVNGVCSKKAQNGAAAAKPKDARNKTIRLGKCILEAAVGT